MAATLDSSFPATFKSRPIRATFYLFKSCIHKMFPNFSNTTNNKKSVRCTVTKQCFVTNSRLEIACYVGEGERKVCRSIEKECYV